MSPKFPILGLLLLVAIAVGMGAVALFGLGRGSRVPAGVVKVAGNDHDWPVFRGGTTFHGLAKGQLPQKLSRKWTFSTQDAVRSSAVIGHGLVFVGSDDGHVYGIDLQSGAEVWRFDTEAPVEAPPLLVDAVIYVGSHDGKLFALDARDGTERWRYKTEGKITGSANYVRSDGGGLHIVVGSYDSMLHCVNAEDGQQLWVYPTDNYINGAPAIANGRVVVGGCDAQLHVVSVTDGESMGKVDLGSYIIATVVLDGDDAFVGHQGNEFVCVDLAAQQVKWTTGDRDFPIFSSAALTDEVVVFGSQGRRLYCVKRSDGEMIWDYSTRGKVDGSPVICGDKVVVGAMDGRLYVVRLSDGSEISIFDLGEPIIASPAVGHGIVVIGCENGNVYAFGAG